MMYLSLGQVQDGENDCRPVQTSYDFSLMWDNVRPVQVFRRTRTSILITEQLWTQTRKTSCRFKLKLSRNVISHISKLSSTLLYIISRAWIMLLCESRRNMWVQKLHTHTLTYTEPLAFRGQSRKRRREEHKKTRDFSAFFPPQLLPTFCKLPRLSPLMNLHTRKQRSFPGRPSFCRHSATFPVSIKTGQIYYQSFWNRISAVQQRIRPLLL